MQPVTGELVGVSFDPVRTPYELDDRMFPHDGSPDEQNAFLLRYAILAPSSYNTQPWKFQLWEDGIAVYADYSRRLPVADPGNRELLIGVGAAIFNLRVAAEYFGLTAHVHLNQSGDSEQPLTFVSLTPSTQRDASGARDNLFLSITKRHTNRNPFLVARIPEAILSTLRTVAEGEQIRVLVSTDGALIRQVANLVADADRIQSADPSLRHEHAEWMHPNWSKQPDGIPGSAFGVKGVTSLFTPWATKVLDRGRQRSAVDKDLCTQAPGLVALSSEDAPHLWLEVGQVLEHLLLTVVTRGLQYSFFNMPIEVPELRTRLRGTLGLHAWPQMLLRIGYSFEPAAMTPRRPLEEVMMPRGPARPRIHLQ
jgi:hypothetical protein